MMNCIMIDYYPELTDTENSIPFDIAEYLEED